MLRQPLGISMACTFRIIRKSRRRDDVHLRAGDILTPADFENIVRELGGRTLQARKIGYVAAREAAKTELIETRWNGKETANTARPGDWIVTNLSPQCEVLRDRNGHENTYVIAADRFSELYERASGSTPFGPAYRARGVVSAIALAGGFDIKAPWGERQTAPTGYLLFNGSEVYGCHSETFAATYEIIAS
jgi:hypothetical protein